MTEDINMQNVFSDVKVVRNKTKDLSKMGIDPELEKVKNFYDNTNMDDVLIKLYSDMIASNPNAKCPSCAGSPKKGTTCKVCGGGRYEKDVEVITSLTEEVTDKLLIPAKYKTERFDALLLKSDYSDLIVDERDKRTFGTYTKILTNILERINNGRLEKSSLFITAPSGMGKEIFAYTALQLAKARGMTVFPYLDLLEVKRFLEAYETRNFNDPIIGEIGFKDVDLYRAEVCILKVPSSQSQEYFNAYKTMLQVIDRRARRDLPTIILSREYANHFFSFDKMNQVSGIIRYNNPSPKNLQVYEVSYRRKGKQDYTQD